MLLSIFTALISSFIFPFSFFLYGRIAGTFVDYTKYQKLSKNGISEAFESENTSKYHQIKKKVVR
jgi:hypothetical protein